MDFIHPIMDLSIECTKCNAFFNFVGKLTDKIVMYTCPKCKFAVNVYYTKGDIGASTSSTSNTPE